jgi:hypothetical protein
MNSKSRILAVTLALLAGCGESFSIKLGNKKREYRTYPDGTKKVIETTSSGRRSYLSPRKIKTTTTTPDGKTTTTQRTTKPIFRPE